MSLASGRPTGFLNINTFCNWHSHIVPKTSNFRGAMILLGNFRVVTEIWSLVDLTFYSILPHLL